MYQKPEQYDYMAEVLEKGDSIYHSFVGNLDNQTKHQKMRELIRLLETQYGLKPVYSEQNGVFVIRTKAAWTV